MKLELIVILVIVATNGAIAIWKKRQEAAASVKRAGDAPPPRAPRRPTGNAAVKASDGRATPSPMAARPIPANQPPSRPVNRLPENAAVASSSAGTGIAVAPARPASRAAPIVAPRVKGRSGGHQALRITAARISVRDAFVLSEIIGPPRAARPLR